MMRAPVLTIIAWTIIVFLFAPLVVASLYAFSAKPLLAWPFEGWSLQWFEKLFGERQFRRAFFTSLEVAAWASLLATVIGTMAAFAMSRRDSTAGRIVLVLSRLPVMLPGLFLGISFVALMIVTRIPPGKSLIIVGHTVVAIPWVVLVMTARLRTYDTDLEAAARDLGAGPAQVLWRVTLPIITPALAGAALLAFAWSFDETLVTIFTAGMETTVPMYVVSRLRRIVDPSVNAVAVLMLLIPWITFLLAAVVMRRSGGIGAVFGTKE